MNGRCKYTNIVTISATSFGTVSQSPGLGPQLTTMLQPQVFCLRTHWKYSYSEVASVHRTDVAQSYKQLRWENDLPCAGGAFDGSWKIIVDKGIF